MRALCALATMTIIMALALTGEARGQAQWQTVTGPGGSFTVEMPGAASYEPVAQKSTQGTPYTLHQYLLPQSHSTLYLAQTAVYPQDDNMSDGKAALQALLNNYAKGLDQVKWISVDWVKHQGLNAVAAYGTTSGGEDQRSFAVIKGQQLFDLEYFGPPGSGKSADVDRFISSLRIEGGGPQRALPPMESIPSRRDRP
jgi:hypothetical protein